MKKYFATKQEAIDFGRENRRKLNKKMFFVVYLEDFGWKLSFAKK